MENRVLKIQWNYDIQKFDWFCKTMDNFEVLEQSVDLDGTTWYSVRVDDNVSEWLFNTFKKDVDFRYIHQLKGVWVEMPGKTLALLKLKWS